MGMGKSSVDPAYRRDNPPKSSVPAANPYANVKAPRGNIGPRNGGDRLNENAKWRAQQSMEDHHRNSSINDNPYKDVVPPSAEVVEGSVVR